MSPVISVDIIILYHFGNKILIIFSLNSKIMHLTSHVFHQRSVINGILFLFNAIIMLRGGNMQFDRLFSFNSYLLNVPSNFTKMVTIKG